MTSLIHVDQRKWPDREHYQFQVTRLGRDEHGTWLHSKPGTLVRGGKGEPWVMPVGAVGMVPEGQWWVAYFYRRHPEIDAYVDIGTPPTWDGTRLTYIDLDLDVIRRLNGTVEIIDQDEFEENRVLFGYPDELAQASIEAAGRVVELLEGAIEPFGEVAAKWMEHLENLE